MTTESFQAKVLAKQEIITTRTLRDYEAELAVRRATWAKQWIANAEQPPPATPRGAFELFIRDYLGADLATVPVVAESDEEIVWHAANPCDTLEACEALGRETRQICRALYDKPVQALLSELDPELRFLRNYEHIRPKATACEERIVRVSFDEFMQLAIEEAEQSRAEGNKGYGAVVARGHEVLASAHDTASTERDPSRHAETNAIRAAVQASADPNLAGCVLVASCEPCPMCAALAVWANVTTIVFGASIEQTAALGKARIRIPAVQIVAKSPATIEVFGGCRQQECLKLYR